MKSNLKHLAIILLVAVGFTSCGDDDTDVLGAPVISSFEYGEGSTHSTEPVAYKGSDIHMEAEIYAEATISSISIDIHADDVTPGDDEVEWDYEETFTGANYQVINAEFHEHIDIPTNIPAGEYHITLTVVDELGNSTEIEGHIDIMDPISISDISIDSTVERGDEIHAEFMIYAVNGIHNITVDIHGHGITVGDGEEEWDFEGEYEDGYHESTEVEFHEHIDVPVTAPAGEYHAVFTIEDEDGNTYEYETEIDVTA